MCISVRIVIDTAHALFSTYDRSENLPILSANSAFVNQAAFSALNLEVRVFAVGTALK